MGEVMVVVARGPRLAQKMCTFINERAKRIADAIGYKYPFTWWIESSARLNDSFTHHRGIGRVMDLACMRWAALKVGRRQKSFPLNAEGHMKFDEPLAYTRYGDFESWPVFPPEQHKLVDVLDGTLLRWCRVTDTGCHFKARDAALYIAHECADWSELLKQAMLEVGFDSDSRDFDHNLYMKARARQEELMEPWLEERLTPLREVMVEVNQEWNE